MIIYPGVVANTGIAIGSVLVYKRTEKSIERYKINCVEDEIQRFNEAKETTIDKLKELYQKASAKAGEESAMIFEVHQMMVNDPEYCNSVIRILRDERWNAEYAVEVTATNLSSIFLAMENDYFRERATDILDVSKRLISVLSGQEENKINADKPVILLADDLVPSETVQLDKNMILGFVTQHGSINSHTAILARTMDIPALIGVDIELNKNIDGATAIIDGDEGKIYINPDDETMIRLEEKQRIAMERKELLKKLKGKDSITKSGKKIKLYANIGGVDDVEKVLSYDAEGIGLFRSEFLYLENNHFPTEEEQFIAYKTVVEKMEGKKVIIRTMDIGADKQAAYFDLGHEENPAMGYRAIRICLDRPDLLKTQLRAIYRVSAYGTISVMFPMIISLDEVIAIKKMVEEVKAELTGEGVTFSEVEFGIMIETPAAAMISDILAQEVDFFSIGTNDLTQYTLAIDRQNQKLDKIYSSHHLAVLRLIEMITKNAHDNNIWVGICGELASDQDLTETFIHMGIDELSVSPGKILEMRNLIRNIV